MKLCVAVRLSLTRRLFGHGRVRGRRHGAVRGRVTALGRFTELSRDNGIRGWRFCESFRFLQFQSWNLRQEYKVAIDADERRQQIACNDWPVSDRVRVMAPRPAEMEALFERYRVEVARYVMRRVGSAATPDIVSDTFAIAFRHSVTPREPLPWLYAIARNLVRNYARAAARQPVAVAACPTQDVADVVADRDLIVRALRALPELSREALMLIAWEGLSPSDAARVIGISSAAFRVRLHRARRQLEAGLGSSSAF